MTGYTTAVWSTLILAELLAISVALNLFWLRRRRRPKADAEATAWSSRIAAVATKARAIKEIYRRIIEGSASDIPSLLASIPSHEREIEELLPSGIGEASHAHQPADADPLQPLWYDLRDGHALLRTMADELLGKTQLLHALMEKMKVQEQLFKELTDLSATYQRELKELIKEPLDRQSIPEVFERLTHRYEILQNKLEELQLTNHNLLSKDFQYRTFSEQYRDFFETLQNLKIENIRLAEKIRIQEPRLDWLRSEKSRLEGEIERFKGLEESYRLSRHKVVHLEEQLQRANEEIQRLKSEMSALTAEYLKLFERQSS
jgi:predicted nuclease with TOPRIM domain